MKEFLTPDKHNHFKQHLQNPYSEEGAALIAIRFRDDVVEMLKVMMANRERYTEGKTLLASSPLRSKPWVAAAMKTLGLVEERPTPRGACGLILTDLGVAQAEAYRNV